MSCFLITGLPRSRTAWLSVVATGRNSHCHHEPLRHTSCFDEYAAFWESPEVPFIGISDSGIVPQLGRVLAEIRPRTLIVRRDIRHVKASLRVAFAGHDMDMKAGDAYLDACHAELQKWFKHPLVRQVDYDALSDEHEVQACMDWLMPGNERRIDQKLMSMNIQADIGQVMANLHKITWCAP